MMVYRSLFQWKVRPFLKSEVDAMFYFLLDKFSFQIALILKVRMNCTNQHFRLGTTDEK